MLSLHEISALLRIDTMQDRFQTCDPNVIALLRRELIELGTTDESTVLFQLTGHGRELLRKLHVALNEEDRNVAVDSSSS